MRSGRQKIRTRSNCRIRKEVKYVTYILETENEPPHIGDPVEEMDTGTDPVEDEEDEEDEEDK